MKTIAISQKFFLILFLSIATGQWHQVKAAYVLWTGFCHDYCFIYSCDVTKRYTLIGYWTEGQQANRHSRRTRGGEFFPDFSILTKKCRWRDWKWFVSILDSIIALLSVCSNCLKDKFKFWFRQVLNPQKVPADEMTSQQSRCVCWWFFDRTRQLRHPEMPRLRQT